MSDNRALTNIHDKQQNNEPIINNLYKQTPIFEILNPVNKKITYSNKEFSLKENNFNPAKWSPNLFMTKLEFRMNNYFNEIALNNDDFKL
jgi:hypothetical protein